MRAEDASEMMDQDVSSADRFKQRAAIGIAILAMLLAVTSLGGSNAAKEALNNSVLSSNYFNFYQAKNMRQTSYELAADNLELSLANPALTPEAKAETQKKIDEYRKTAARYESEPETQEGKRELLTRAKAYEQKRDIALKQDPYFDYAEVLLQIAIVLVSVAIVSGLAWLAVAGGALGIAGTLLMLNGYLLLVEVPGLG